ncbi:hypothetical protein [Nonomuraea typhae]|uniref:Phosphatase n=1 Tax=Nonomuraea typhae TaxID=2603600 RepID=A0ABW7YJB6_9ACTN
MKVDLSKQPITSEALETRLRNAKNAAAAVHGYLASAVAEFRQTHSGAELQIFLHEVSILETSLDIALRHAESIVDQVRQEVERVEAEDEMIGADSPKDPAGR